MDYGIFIFATDKAMPVLELAPDVESRGFDSFWVPEHVHIPVKRETPFPGTPDGSLPDPYFRCQDPFTLLAGVAAVTSTLKIGTGICLVSQHEPIDLAKRVATLDLLSGGRFLFGIGAGWLREEMEPLGTPFEKRWQVTAERVAAMKALWTQEKAEYHGDYVSVPKTYSYPKPAQTPHPPVYIGAGSRWGPPACRRVGRRLVAQQPPPRSHRARHRRHPRARRRRRPRPRTPSPPPSSVAARTTSTPTSRWASNASSSRCPRTTPPS